MYLSYLGPYGPTRRNGLKFIAKSNCASNWKHVPSDLNSSYILSDGCRPDKLLRTKSWISGPKFFNGLPDSWPIQFGKTTLDVKNIKAFDQKATSTFLITEMIEPVNKLNTYFSSWFDLKKPTTWLLKFETFLINFGTVYRFNKF